MGRLSNYADVVATFSPKPNVHYKLSCYVCGPACHQPAPFEGWATFAYIFSQRPDGCRYGVAKALVLQINDAGKVEGRPSEQWIAWDFYADGWDASDQRQSGVLKPPPVVATCATEDGLIMKVMALYGRLPPPSSD